jgi:transcriptional regulator GlxA family with amidase domain
MLSVAITAPVGAASLGTAGLLDALRKADESWKLRDPDGATRLFDVRLVGLDGGPVPCRDGVQLLPGASAANIPTPDLVIVPGLDDDLADSFVQNRDWVPWIGRWYAAGARIASACTGAFLVADTGLLDGRPVTTHWLYADELLRRYPKIVLSADQMIVDDGDIISSGGATGFLTLVLYLVERFGGHERANLAAKVLLVDGRESQLPYVAFNPERTHDDMIVHQIQQHIDMHLGDPIRVGELASRFGLGSRTLSRRFVTAIGQSPQAYLQRARLQEAKRLLENSGENVDYIRRRVGYHDPSAFRRAFKEATGLTPTEYRNSYGLRSTAGPQTAPVGYLADPAPYSAETPLANRLPDP